MPWILFLFPILMLVAFGGFIDSRRKKNNNTPTISTHPHAKPGDSTNYLMGDNHNYTDGGQ